MFASDIIFHPIIMLLFFSLLYFLPYCPLCYCTSRYYHIYLCDHVSPHYYISVIIFFFIIIFFLLLYFSLILHMSHYFIFPFSIFSCCSLSVHFFPLIYF